MYRQIAATCTLSTFLITALVTVSARHAGATPVPQSISSVTEFSVEFTTCVESIGLTLVSTERARALIPTDFHLAGDAAPVTPLVVRTRAAQQFNTFSGAHMEVTVLSH